MIELKNRVVQVVHDVVDLIGHHEHLQLVCRGYSHITYSDFALKWMYPKILVQY